MARVGAGCVANAVETAVGRIVASRNKKPISKPTRNREELDVSRVKVDHKDGKCDDPPVGT